MPSVLEEPQPSSQQQYRIIAHVKTPIPPRTPTRVLVISPREQLLPSMHLIRKRSLNVKALTLADPPVAHWGFDLMSNYTSCWKTPITYWPLLPNYIIELHCCQTTSTPKLLHPPTLKLIACLLMQLVVVVYTKGTLGTPQYLPPT